MKNLFLGFCLAFLSLTVFAQKKDGLFSRKNVANQYATVGIGGGSSYYWGDLSPYSSPHIALYNKVRWNGTFNYTRVLNQKFSARVSYSYIRIMGDDNSYSEKLKKQSSLRMIRNLHFRNDVQEIAFSGTYNLLPQYGKGAYGRAKVMPYVSFGVALFAHNPKAKGPIGAPGFSDSTSTTYVPNEFIALRPLNTAGQTMPGNRGQYSILSASLPLGLGLKYKLNKNFDIAIEAGIRLTAFEYLDDVGSDPYVDPTVLLANFGPASQKLSYRADEIKNPLNNADRIPQFIQGTALAGNPLLDPSTDAVAALPYSTKRGSTKPDSYGVIQITLNYVLGKSIKCPPIK